MGSKVILKLTRNGPMELRTLPAMESDLLDRARRIDRAAGGGFEVDSQRKGGGRAPRARATVAAVTYEQRLREAEDRALTRAIDAGR